MRATVGRTLMFLASMMERGKLPEARAIAIEERTAALTETYGRVVVGGEGSVYFVRARKSAEICKPGVPLTFRGLASTGFRTVAISI